jgi:N-acetylglucosaminyldiphosphoundecaprenol N-acetyl-beta-D-mannosaminyltransferase
MLRGFGERCDCMNLKSACVLGTPLAATAYGEFTGALQELARQPRVVAVDFSNTHVVTLRRHDATFRELTSRFDFFVPDGMPLIWCLNWQGMKLRDRVYGPTFMRQCILNSPAPLTHYFLGGSEECLRRLKEFFLEKNPALKIVGSRNGYFRPDQEAEIIEEINRLAPDFIWIGLGTPKQQEWIYKYKSQLKRGIILAVGFAFDVNAGTKPDAPAWMQRLGLTWVFRIVSEPRRLATRYFKYNSLFLFYLLWDGVRGRAFKKNELPQRF